jgi:trehalose 6-phosphate phosphatase
MVGQRVSRSDEQSDLPRVTEYDLLGAVRQRLAAGGQVGLFLDYDGTLVPIARTPEDARPSAALLQVLTGLAGLSTIRVVILSGRSLSSLQAMLPVPGLTLAGIYGIEIQMPDQSVVIRSDPPRLRPVLEQVKSAWAQLVAERPGFLLEDKGLAVALHARFAGLSDADFVLPQAQSAAAHVISPAQFRVLSGDRFLEVAPATAYKGQTMEWLLDLYMSRDALLIYCGDDDQDEEAFAVVRRRGGIPIVVGQDQHATLATNRFGSPDALRGWLQLVAALTTI